MAGSTSLLASLAGRLLLQRVQRASQTVERPSTTASSTAKVDNHKDKEGDDDNSGTGVLNGGGDRKTIRGTDGEWRNAKGHQVATTAQKLRHAAAYRTGGARELKGCFSSKDCVAPRRVPRDLGTAPGREESTRIIPGVASGDPDK